MRRFAVGLGAACVSVLVAAAPALARLSPVEQAWVTPLLKIYNVENASLKVVQQQERARGALVVGAKNDTLLTETLLQFIDCPVAVKAAGKPPSLRLETFAADMTASCDRLAAGGNDVGKAIGEIHVADVPRARSYLASSLAEFVAGTRLLAAAEHQLLAVGGRSVFTA